MKKCYVVYLNKSYDVWMRDASKWAKDNSIEYTEILSEPVFWHYMSKGLLTGVPVFFVKDILTEHR